ncbi:phosphatases II [Linnemannia elongata AG-77]|uniref:phosphatidylinositol-3,4,5-trisphosphate 3-phosphatase n=1 Tax=Linnemannia elongata AG-77 TaxID=1314771 RepID=A0A197K7L5_9FUNG|nr:phosphatases II [Linnemannia elongata AG-77]
MGYPSKSLEAFYRNPMSDVEKFLDARHEGAYKVYNLCSERSYSDQRFHGRVAQFPFPDHSPPPFQLIHPFCEDVSDWLHTTSGNVVAIHCKAGKGRTGVMICSFLVHCGATAEEAIQLYGQKRTLDGCGVTIPSQLRYIRYYEQFLESRTLNYDPRLLVLQELVIDTIPKPLLNVEPLSKYLILTIMSSDVKIYESVPQHVRCLFLLNTFQARNLLSCTHFSYS